MDEAEHGLHDLLLERLLADDAVDDEVAGLILAAWAGDEELAAVAAGRPSAASDPTHVRPRAQSPDAYLAAVHVEGFRGIGDAATLPLRPGPGLTLVTGRNGSGKSSFAEAAELVMTGTSGRWAGRTTVWREGWRNLHATGPTRIGVDLVTAGSHGITRIERTWEPGSELDGGHWTRQRSGEKRTDFDASEWREDMQTYRPFLSYSELGALIDGKPSELYDALHSLLGLGPLGEAQERLRIARKRLADGAKAVGAARRTLRTELSGIDSPRVARAAALLAPANPDLVAIADLVAGVEDSGGESMILKALVGLEVPDAETVAAATRRVRVAADRVGELADDEIRSADRIAALLRSALQHQHGRDAGPCPVCLRGTLDDAWREDAGRRARELEAAAHGLRQASAELDQTVGACRVLVTPIPRVLSGAVPVDVSALRTAWTSWADAARTTGPSDLAHAIERVHGALLDAMADARARAQAELVQRDEVWAPIARRLSAWHDDAQRVAAQSSLLVALERAEKWLSVTSGELRDQRLAPFAAQSQHLWQMLRQQSNVDLGPVRLDGAKTRRRVAMDVRVDGADGGTALGVMSQGELHALGLSLFLPRATVDHSPFRFVLIDDPVQAMDPAKVDGLARVLADVATTRQVVVFTHDDRLADAVRRLELPATVWEVHRGERSVVEMRHSDDPVKRYLLDAKAMALTKELPPDVRGELVASCCRSAIEAVCHTKIRAVRFGRGDTHASVEDAIAAANTTHKKATLAIFDDPSRGGDLLGRLRAVGPWAVDAFQRCRQGAHHGLTGDLRPFIRDVERLAEWLQR